MGEVTEIVRLVGEFACAVSELEQVYWKTNWVKPEDEMACIVKMNAARSKLIELTNQDNQRIAYLEEQLRWRPVSEVPEKSGYYEVEFDNGNFYDMIFYNAHDSWRCNQEHVNITGWRPIPELKVDKTNG